MKKISLLILTLICFCTISVQAEGQCNKTQTNTNEQCQKTCDDYEYENYNNACPPDGFLCTKANADTLFKQMNLSETQICTAMKIQDKYEEEVLSLNERLEYERTKLSQLKNQTCNNNSKDIKNTKNTIKRLERKKREICDCYEKQFKSILSDMQINAYNKYKK